MIFFVELSAIQIANIDQPLFIIDNFISDEENDHVLAHGRDKLHQSTILGMTSKSNEYVCSLTL